MKEYFRIAINDVLDHMSYSIISSHYNLDDAIKRWHLFAWEKVTIPDLCTIKIDMKSDEFVMIDIFEGEGAKEEEIIFRGTVELIFINARDRYEKLTKLVHMSELAPPDRMDMAINEGFELEEVLIRALEEVDRKG